ncbi:17813_t:CDS:2 [Cetraspora pellucida]|uniref:17813_t:CDS:1 n=1 Tax=Cetraspora pellucida TaxID=1433469 RepID=A0A9N9BAD6_9GLOM|nr:17813_t:CDS:2 [Cetraspora pellucida]
MNALSSLSQYCVNDNGCINLPFSHAVETYINSLLLLTNCKLKKQSRLYKTVLGQNKSTNRLDDILELTEKGCTHRPLYIPVALQPKVARINLSLQSHDHAIAAHHAYRSTGAEIALKLLAPYNNMSATHLKYVCETDKNGKYDLNNEKAPVLSMVIKDEARYGSSLAFGLSEKENHHTI